MDILLPFYVCLTQKRRVYLKGLGVWGVEEKDTRHRLAKVNRHQLDKWNNVIDYAHYYVLHACPGKSPFRIVSPWNYAFIFMYVAQRSSFHIDDFELIKRH